MRSTVKAVVFDLDDTLYSERQYALSGFAAVAVAFEARLGDPDRAIMEMKTLVDTENRPRVFNALLNQRGLPEDERLIAGMIETYRRHEPKISLYPDADAALTRLRPMYKLGLISDGRPTTQTLKLQVLKLHLRLDKIILTGELGMGYGKPHLRAFEWMAESLDVEPEQCAYIADNAAKDFVAPNALGWTTIRIVRPDGIYRDVPSAEGGSAGYTINTLNELV